MHSRKLEANQPYLSLGPDLETMHSPIHVVLGSKHFIHGDTKEHF